MYVLVVSSNLGSVRIQGREWEKYVNVLGEERCLWECLFTTEALKTNYVGMYMYLMTSG